MKSKLFLSTVVLTLSLLPSSLKAQIGRNEWSYGIVLTADNVIYAGVADLITILPAAIVDYDSNGKAREKMGEFYVDNKWWIPKIRYRSCLVKKMEFAGEKAEIYPKTWGWSHIDWKMRNYAVGYHVGYLSRTSPLGFDLQADYVQDGHEVKMPGDEESQDVIKRMLSTTALVKVRLMEYDSHRLNPVVEIGGSYNYAFHYHDDTINDKNAVNNGFTGIIGLGFTNTETHISWSLRYEHSFYNFYNKDFMYEGKAIYADSKTTFGTLCAAISYGF